MRPRLTRCAVPQEISWQSAEAKAIRTAGHSGMRQQARLDLIDGSMDIAASHLRGGVAEVARHTLRRWPGAPLLCCAGLLLAVKGLCFIARDGCKGCITHMN